MTLIELMVGLAIGLVATLAIASVLINSEEQKRTTTGGMDAQVNGALALSAMEREISKAGYGFSSIQGIVGCPLANMYKGSGLAGLPTTLAPLLITDGASGQPDIVRSVAGNKSSFSVPILVTSPAYTPGSTKVYLASVRGIKGPTYDSGGKMIKSGDLLIAATDAVNACQIFEATADPTDKWVDRADTTNWNPSGWPNKNYDYGSYLVNLGNLRDISYSLDQTTGDLKQTSMVQQSDGSATYQTFTLYNNVVQLQAYYGKDTNADGAVDTWNNVTPSSNAEWLQVIAVRLAVVTRSTQREKDEVTLSNPLWDVGATNAPTGAVACGTSKCVTLKLDYPSAPADWKHYRYKTFDTVIPLRNVIWMS